MKRPLVVVSFGVLLFSVIIVMFFSDVLFGKSSYSEGNIVTITGKIQKIEEKTNSYYVYLNSQGRKILVTLDKDSYDQSDYCYGNVITAKCVYKEMANARNLGNYDEEKYLKSIGVCQKYKALTVEIIDDHVDWIPELLRKLKNKIACQILKSLPNDEDEAGVLIAMTTGDRSYLNDETVDLYKSSGIAHILAISGLHISFVGMGLYKLLRKRFKFIPSAVCAVAVTILYCIMSGASASSVRAAVMVVVRLGAIGLGKKYDMLNGALLALILILLPAPYYITNSGFQLSFAAIAGIAILGPEVSKFLTNMLVRDNCQSCGFLKKTLSKFACVNRSFELDSTKDERDVLVDKKIKSAKTNIVKACSSSISISLATLPIILSVYFEFPLYGFLINMVILPLTSYLLGGGLSGSFAGLSGFLTDLGGSSANLGGSLAGLVGTAAKSLFGFAGKIILSACCVGLGFISWVCSFFSKLPFATICTGAPNTLNIFFYYALLSVCICILKILNRHDEKMKAKRLECSKIMFFTEKTKDAPPNLKLVLPRFKSMLPGIFKILTFAGGIVLLILLLVPNRSSSDLQITFIDVDQGECIFISSPSGKTYMIDAGSTGVSQVFKYRIENTLKYQGINSIDYLIVTHPDTDHISGVEEMLEDVGVEISNILIPEFGENETYLEILSLAKANNIPVTQLRSGISIKDGQLSLKCIYPYASEDASDTQSISDDVNDMSAVTLLEYENFTALFTGDIEKDVETRIMKDVGEITLLNVAHHGSKNSSCLEFLRSASPEYAIISAGVNNSYGHPHQETLTRLATIGAKTYCTADYGEIIVNVNTSEIDIETPVYSTDFTQ